jgi:hypothetical protein
VNEWCWTQVAIDQSAYKESQNSDAKEDGSSNEFNHPIDRDETNQEPANPQRLSNGGEDTIRNFKHVKDCPAINATWENWNRQAASFAAAVRDAEETSAH